MRIRMAASAAGVMVLVAGCGAAAAPAPTAPPSTQASATAPAPTPASSVQVARDALTALVASSDTNYYGEAESARFVTEWWDSLNEGTQMFACSHWKGMNFDRIIRDYVAPEWNATTGGSVWDSPAVRLELMDRLDTEC